MSLQDRVPYNKNSQSIIHNKSYCSYEMLSKAQEGVIVFYAIVWVGGGD